MTFQPKIGEILLNKYETISPLGDGAFGSVWRARDIKLERIVAVKFINTTTGILSRFSDELEAIKNLEHPNIVKLYDFDILRGGVPCIVMELVKGREIGDVLMSDGPFSGQRLCNIILQVVDALVETHKHNIVHCDLKPENIMLMNVGAREDVVKLIDFGVASIMSKDSNGSDKKKMLVGTPQYMAPEQIRHEMLGPWTDIYALGLIMIELFTGQFVFDHEDPREVLRMQLHNPVTIPHKLACTPLGPIVARAVEKDVSKRYQSTQEFYEDLRAASRMMQTMVVEQPLRSRFDSTMLKRIGSSELGDDEDDFMGDLNDLEGMVAGSSGRVPELERDREHRASNVPLLNAASISKNSLKAVPGMKNLPLMEGMGTKGKTTGSGHVMIESQKTDSSDKASGGNKKEDKSEFENLNLGNIQSVCESMTVEAPFELLKKAMEAADNSPSEEKNKPKSSEKEKKISASTPKPAAVLHQAPQQRSTVKPVLLLIAILLVIGGAAYAWNSGYLESKGIIKPEPEPEPVQVAPEPVAEARPQVVKYATIRAVAKQMAYVSAISGHLGKSPKAFKNIMPYRVFGTPIQADIYVNDSLICTQSPCNLNIFGDPSKIRIEIRDGEKNKAMVLGKHDPFKPIILVLDP